MKKIFTFLFLLPLLPLAAQAALDAITIDLPQGQQMRFIPVAVSDNPNLFASRSFSVGSGRYSTEPISAVQLSGTLFRDGKWYIPFAETELTRGQYAAVMGTPQPAEKERDLPQAGISVTDVQQFLVKLNALMAKNKSYQEGIAPYCNEKSSAPFCRMPTAIEWEYAARGGAAVDEMTFDANTPYPDGTGVEKYEVCFNGGRREPSAKAVKGSRLPNPLGLYDMLGNVSEWVSPIYYFDCQQGRSGGILACGGNFRTEKKSLHSSERTEYEPYDADGKECRRETIGVRFVLGSVIRHKEMSMENFQQEWAVFSEEMRTPVKSSPTETTEEAVKKVKESYSKDIARLTEEVCKWQKLQEKSDAESISRAKQVEILMQQLAQLQAKAEGARNIENKGHQKIAEAAVMMISTAAIHLNAYYTKLAYIQSQHVDDERLAELKNAQIRTFQGNIEGAKKQLSKGCELFAEAPVEIGDDEAARQLALLEKENPLQHRCLLPALDYAKNRRAKGKFDSFAPLEAALKAAGAETPRQKR